MGIDEINYKISRIWIDNKRFYYEFTSVKELEAFLYGFFEGVNFNE